MAQLCKCPALWVSLLWKIRNDFRLWSFIPQDDISGIVVAINVGGVLLFGRWSISNLSFLPSICNSMQVLLLTCLLCLCVSDCPVHKVIMLSLKAGHFFNFMLQSLPIHNYTQPKADNRTLLTFSAQACCHRKGPSYVPNRRQTHHDMVRGNYWWGHKVILLIANSAVPRRPWSPCGCSSPPSLRAFARCLSCHGRPPWPSLVVFCNQMVIITVIVVMLDDMESHWWYVNWQNFSSCQGS